MAELDKDELKKLSPTQKLKKLKELEEERKKEATEIDTLIKESMKEIKTDEVATEITPEPRDVDIGRLFGAEEEQLEQTVKAESREEEQLKYISTSKALEDYEVLQDISYASMMGTIKPAQMDAVDKIGERLDRAKYVSASAEAANILVASKATLHKIKKYAGLD
jgi:hypothetical protein|tara:strand:- start:347 stop:841 length:495 start_codon:yes stop_codon:yes gene_type:complete